jgi:hypothetical protein
VAGRSKARVYGQYFVGIAGSDPVGVMDVCFLWVLYVGQVDVSAAGRSLVQRIPTDWCDIVCDLETSRTCERFLGTKNCAVLQAKLSQTQRLHFVAYIYIALLFVSVKQIALATESTRTISRVSNKGECIEQVFCSWQE